MLLYRIEENRLKKNSINSKTRSQPRAGYFVKSRHLFQPTPPLRVETANLYSDTQYFPYRFGEIHNFALSPPTFLSSQSTKTALWAIFLARSSRKFYDCLGFAPSSTYSIISPGWQSRYLHRLSMVLVSI